MSPADAPSPTPPRRDSATRRLFVSHTATDRAWAEWIAWQLEAAGYQIELDLWDFRAGEHFLQQMDQGIARADWVVAVLSEDYLASTYAAEEWRAALVRDRGQPARLLPVRVRPCTLPPLLAGRIYVDLVGVDEATAAQRLLTAAAGSRGKPTMTSSFPGGLDPAPPQVQPPFPGLGPAISNLPPRNPHFTDGAGLLGELEVQLGAQGAVMLVAAYGLGGVGKTQLALEYAHRHAGDHELVWWVTAETPTQAVGALSALAPRVGLEVEADLEATAEAVVEALGRRTGWLLIFDNAEDPELIARLLPSGSGGRVLVTSRDPIFAQLGAAIQVEVWPVEVAAGFLLERTGDRDQETAAALAQELGGLPLALAQAVAYCQQTSLDLAGYLARYRTRRRDLLARGRLVGYPEAVATTWQLNLDQLQASQPEAVELLRLLAFLAPDAIPLELLSVVPELLPEGLGGVVVDELALDAVVAGLYRFSLIRRHRIGLGVHRLVQAVIRDQLTVEQTRRWAGCAVGLLYAALPEDPAEPRNWPRYAALVAHAQAAAAHASACHAAPEVNAWLLQWVGIYLYCRAELAAARISLERALALYEAVHGTDHPDVAKILNNLGLVLHQLGELPAARSYQERALTLLEAVHGPNHPDVAVALLSLGNVLRERGELPAARGCLERALAILEATYGPDHPHVASTLTTLGSVLHQLGELPTARRCLERALVIKEAAHGPNHPNVAKTLNNLGLVLRSLGVLPLAQEYLERALAIDEALFGPDHLNVAVTLVNLGNMLRERGELPAARGCLERALAILETAHGPDHQQVASALTNLSIVLRELGELPAARQCLERALVIFRRTLGPGHAHTQEAERLLGELPGDQT